MAEKIKVSFLIDKQAVYDCAFRNADNEEEYNQVKEILDKKDEIVRDVEHSFDDKEVVSEMTKEVASIGIDELLFTNKDLLLSKRKQKEVDDAEHHEGKNDCQMKCVKLSGDEARELIRKIFGKED